MKYCIKIENKDTYELFDNIQEAFLYLNLNPNSVLSLVYAKNLYYEEDKTLNYDDYSDTILKEVNAKGFK